MKQNNIDEVKRGLPFEGDTKLNSDMKLKLKVSMCI